MTAPPASQRRAFVIGWPVGHSRSPMIHNHWLERHGIDARYERVPVRPEDLAGFIEGLAETDYIGGNVTLPHKERVFSLVSRTEPAADTLGAVNTVFRLNGVLTGTSTDGYGYMQHLRATVPSWSPAAGPSVVLGAGGAARAIAAALRGAGVAEIRIVNRSMERAAILAGTLCPGARVYPWCDRAAALDSARLLVNTTSLGMVGMPPLEIDISGLPDDAVVSDIVYVPLRTGLLRKAGAAGLRTVDGLGMLLHQAVPGFEAWFGVRPEVDGTLRAIIENDIVRSS